MGGNTGGIVQGVIGVVLIVVGALSSPVGWGLIAMGVGMLVGAVASTMAEQKAKKAQQRNSQSLESNGHLINTRDTQEVVRLIYGRMKVGGNIVYIATTGGANEYLHMIITLGEGELDACEQVWLDDKPISDFGSLAYYEFYNGGANQTVCSTLNAAKPEWTDPLRHTAYLYVRLQYDPNKFTGQPTVTALVRGRKLFDPRTGITAWSENPSLVFYDLFTNKRYAFGFSSSLLDTASIITTANWCDTNTYKLDGAILAQDAGLDVVEQIMANYRAVSLYNAGTYKLKVLDTESPVMSLTEDDIKIGSFSFDVPGLPETPNRTRVKFPNKDNGYNTEDLIVEDLNALTVEGYERENTITLIGTTDWAQAQKLAVYNLERSRLNKAYHFISGPKSLPLEHGDCISITHTLPGWTNKLCRVIAMSVSGQNEVSLSVLEEDANLYNDVIDIDTHTYSSTTLPNPLAAPPEATAVVFSEGEYYNKDVSYTRLKISFTKPASPFWSYSEVWVNVAGAGYQHYTDVTGDFTIEPVKETVQYKIKMISVSINGVKQNFSTATEWTYNIVGHNTPPPDAANFRAIPQSDTIILMWDAVNIVDLQGYEIRKGTSWDGGIFIGFTRAVTFQINGVAPGSHTYILKSVDTNGKYSVNAAIASCTVYGPASYTEKMSQYSDFNEAGEVHSNTQRYVDATHGVVLRVNRQNSITNYNFETDTSGWNLETGWARSNAQAQSGSWSIASPSNGSGAGTKTYKNDAEIMSSAGVAYAFSAWVRSDTPNQARLGIVIDSQLTQPGIANGVYIANGALTAGGQDITTYSNYHSGNSTWEKLQVNLTPVIGNPKPKAMFLKDITAGQAYFDNCAYSNAGLIGKYTSPVYDRASVLTRRSWPQFDLVFIGSKAAWDGQFTAAQLWTDRFIAADTWLTLFGQFNAGNIKMRLGYSTDGSSYSWVDYFESYVVELQARYMKYEVTITDVELDSYLYCKPITYKEAYWQ